MTNFLAREHDRYCKYDHWNAFSSFLAIAQRLYVDILQHHWIPRIDSHDFLYLICPHIFHYTCGAVHYVEPVFTSWYQSVCRLPHRLLVTLHYLPKPALCRLLMHAMSLSTTLDICTLVLLVLSGEIGRVVPVKFQPTPIHHSRKDGSIQLC